MYGQRAPKSSTATRHRRVAARWRPGSRLLGLRPGSSSELVRLVREGFAFSRLSSLEKISGLSREKLARFAGISPRTLTRRQGGRLRAEESDRVLRISRLFELAFDLFEGHIADARDWLQAPQPGLGGEAPLAFASTEVGAREVEHLIGRLEHGIVA